METIRNNKGFPWFTWLLLALALAFLLSCGSRKREVNRETSYRDIVDNSRLDSILGSFRNINLSTMEREVIYEPVFIEVKDTLVPRTRVIFRDRVKDSIVYERDTLYISKKNDIKETTGSESEDINVERKGTPWWAYLIIACALLFIIDALKSFSKYRKN